MLDFDERRIADARRFVENLEDQLQYTPPDMPIPVLDSIEGTDSSGTVHCIVRLDGRPERIVITDGWWETVGPAGIADAVLQAHRTAGEKAGLAKLVLRRHGRVWRTRATAAEEPLDDLPYPTGQSTMHDLEELRHRIDRSVSRITTAMQRFRERTQHEQREVTGPGRMFTVVLRGPVIVAAHTGSRRPGPGDGSDLAADALAALLVARPGSPRPGER
jgi:hypothetical protein